jgi:hypothetical protein
MARAKKDAHAGWGRVREDAHRIALSDEGGALFVYDEAHARAIAADLPKNPGSPKDPAHARLAADGRLVTVILGGDGPARLELAVGPPLDEHERGAASFLDPQDALLDLPSGRLHVETPSTIPIPRPDPDADPGFVTEVPPGRYRMRVHRLERRAAGGPSLFVTLTRVPSKERVPTPAVLPWIERQDDSWIGRSAVDGGTFKGLALATNYWDSLSTNLEPKDAQALGFAPGQGLRVHVPDLPFTSEAIYSPDPFLFGVLVALTSGEKRGMPPEFAVAHWEDDDETGRVYLRFWRLKTKRCFEKDEWGTWRPAELSLVAPPKLPAKFLEKIALTGPRAVQAQARHEQRLAQRPKKSSGSR